MKKCPYCGHEMADDATKCEKCFVGFPSEEPKQETKHEEPEQKPVPKRKLRS